MLRKVIGTAVVATALAVSVVPAAEAVPVVRLGGVQQTAPTFDGLSELVAQRILIGDDVAASKYFSGKPVDDPVREQQILEAVRASAVRLGIDPDSTAAFFRAQIEASKVVQRGLLAYWAAHPGKAPTTGPDLNVIRERLDTLTTQLLAELVRVDDLRQAGLRCDISLAIANAATAAHHHLDGLHRQALRTASTATC
ncbi:chorismate mutase [Kribbella sp. NPDC003505]|uniref:chorismate mutase n=1 Tax=Kribbella sp. NPDC003505 TaxID=3154448 RepID=UPI0033A7B41B